MSVHGEPSPDAVREMPAAGSRPETSSAGLTAAEVAQRTSAGLTNASTVRTSRTVLEIVRANVFTFFNGLLAVLWVVAIASGRRQNALFGGVVVANAVIGIVQELRAKRTLDELAVLSAPRARVVRNGAETEVAVADVVLDDVLGIVAGGPGPGGRRRPVLGGTRTEGRGQ